MEIFGLMVVDIENNQKLKWEILGKKTTKFVFTWIYMFFLFPKNLHIAKKIKMFFPICLWILPFLSKQLLF